MPRPMLPLARGVAILDERTRLTRLKTSAPLLAALGTAADRRIAKIMVHDVPPHPRQSRHIWKIDVKQTPLEVGMVVLKPPRQRR